MPGLVGIIGNFPAGGSEERTRLMLRAVLQEPFYTSGFYGSPSMFIYIGWTCHKGGFADCLPIFNENKDIVLFLAGEVFDEPSVKKQLRTKGHNFSERDATYLVHLYEEVGDKFFVKLNGFFSGILIDQRYGKTFLFNDRFGMQRIFVHHGKEGYFFSSEAKALLKTLPETREFDLTGMCEFLTCGCTLGDQSLFKGIEILPGGSILEFENGSLRRKTYYFDRSVWESRPKLSKDEFASSVTGIFPGMAKKYLSSQTPVAMSLTGGIDSRVVIACVSDNPGALPCYTFGSMYRDTSDVKISRKVAAACSQRHHTLVLGPEFLRDFPTYLEKAVYTADGYIGLDGAAELFLNKSARQIAPIRLTGNYGGELLRGVRAFKSLMPKGGFVNSNTFTHSKEAQERFNEMSSINDPVSFAAFVQAPNQSFGRRAVEQSQVILRTPFLDNDLIGLMYRFPFTPSLGREVAVEVIARQRPSLLNIPTDRGWIQDDASLGKLPYRLYQKALFKAEYWTNHGMPNLVVALNRFLPWLDLDNLFLGRHKFHHFRSWLRNYFWTYIKDLLIHDLQECLSDYFNPKKVIELVEEHQNGIKNWTDEIDQLVTLTLAHKHLL